MTKKKSEISTKPSSKKIKSKSEKYIAETPPLTHEQKKEVHEFQNTKPKGNELW